MNIKESDYKKIVVLLESMSDTIDKLKRYIKPREADKARQARLILKKIRRDKNMDFGNNVTDDEADSNDNYNFD